MTITGDPMTTQLHRVYIKATPEAVWEALTSAGWTSRYGRHTCLASYELWPGGRYLVRATEEFPGGRRRARGAGAGCDHRG